MSAPLFGREVASTADLRAQFTYQKSKAYFLMVIVWGKGVEESSGMSVQRIKPDRWSELSERDGFIDTRRDQVL